MNMTQLAFEMRTAIQFFVGTLDTETQLDMVLEIPSLYPAGWEVYTVSTAGLRRLPAGRR